MSSEFATHLSQDGMILRPLSDADVPDIVRHLSDQAIASWLAAVPQPYSRSDAEALLDHSRQSPDHVRAVEIEGKMVACLSVGPNLWFWTAPDHHQRGIMKTALRLALGEWFARPAPPLIATCRKDNHASRALLLRLGFSEKPHARRMYFQSIARSEACADLLMAPEQWHLLNPPRFCIGSAHLRPACQKDATTLSRMLRGQLSQGEKGGDLSCFIETHRFRGTASGLFMIEDKMQRSVGAILLAESQAPSIHFLSDEDAAGHSTCLEHALENGLLDRLKPDTLVRPR